MLLIEEYITLSRDERRKHLDLSEPCIERGGNSVQHRGILVQYLDTTFPWGSKIQLAHACHNGKCSNPKHLYWATAYENAVIDQKENGTYMTPHQKMVAKYGVDKTNELCRKAASIGGKSTSLRGPAGMMASDS